MKAQPDQSNKTQPEISLLDSLKNEIYEPEQFHLFHNDPVCGKPGLTTFDYGTDNDDLDFDEDFSTNFRHHPFIWCCGHYELYDYFDNSHKVIDIDDQMFCENFDNICTNIKRNMQDTDVEENRLRNLCSLFAQFQLDKNLPDLDSDKYCCVFADKLHFAMFMGGSKPNYKLNLYVTAFKGFVDSFGLQYTGEVIPYLRLKERHIEVIYCYLNALLTTNWREETCNTN